MKYDELTYSQLSKISTLSAKITDTMNLLIKSLSEVNTILCEDINEDEEYYCLPSFVVLSDYDYSRYYITKIENGCVNGTEIENCNEYSLKLSELSINEIVELAEYLL